MNVHMCADRRLGPAPAKPMQTCPMRRAGPSLPSTQYSTTPAAMVILVCWVNPYVVDMSEEAFAAMVRNCRKWVLDRCFVFPAPAAQLLVARRVGTYRFVYVCSCNRCCFNVMYLGCNSRYEDYKGCRMATIPFLVVFASYKDVHRSGLVKNQYHV